MDSPLLMTSEAARLLNRSAASVREYEKRGLLPALKTKDGRRLFREADVMTFAAKLGLNIQEQPAG